MSKPRGHARVLFDAGIDSVIVAVELYNRPSDVGRSHGAVILLQHGIEMLLKAAMLKRKRKIRDNGEAFNYGFRKCVNIAESELNFLTASQATELRALEYHRDTAVHDVLNMPEDLLYFTIHGGVQVSAHVLTEVFGVDLESYLPPRALPIAASVPLDLQSVIESNIEQARTLLEPGKRRSAEARSILRTVANIEAALVGETRRASDEEILRLAADLRSGAEANALFPGVAALALADPAGAEGVMFVGVKIANTGPPVRFAGPDEEAHLIRQVNDFDKYIFSSLSLGAEVGVTAPKARALAAHFGLPNNLMYQKPVRFPDGKFTIRYTAAAAKLIAEQLATVDIDLVWKEYYADGGR